MRAAPRTCGMFEVIKAAVERHGRDSLVLRIGTHHLALFALQQNLVRCGGDRPGPSWADAQAAATYGN